MKKIIGITGGIACGKSNISSIIREKYYLLDCDEITHNLWEYDTYVQEQAIAYFKEDIKKDGKIDRKKIAQIVFHDEEKLSWLNQMLHPRILAAIHAKIDASKEEYIFIDAPLLFEVGLDKICDIILCAYVPYDVQVKRLMERDHLTEVEASSRISLQMSLEEKVRHSTYRIDTSGSFAETRRKVLNVVEEIIRCHSM